MCQRTRRWRGESERIVRRKRSARGRSQRRETKRPGVRQNKRTDVFASQLPATILSHISPSSEFNTTPRYFSSRYVSIPVATTHSKLYLSLPLPCKLMHHNTEEILFIYFLFCPVKMNRNEKKCCSDARCRLCRKEGSPESHVFWLPKLETSDSFLLHFLSLPSHDPFPAEQRSKFA